MIIKDIFDVQSGQVLSRISTKINQIAIGKVLIPKAISKGRILKEELQDIKLKNLLPENKLSMKNDIIIKLSTPYEACVIDDDNVGLVIPSFCAILRIKKMEFDLNYLNAYINSSLFEKQVIDCVTGQTIGILSITALKGIDIPHIPLKEQLKVSIEFKKMNKNKELLNKLINLQEEKIETLIKIGEQNE